MTPTIDATFEEIKRWALKRALRAEKGNKVKAAKRLGVSFKTVYNWLESFEKDTPCTTPFRE